MTKTTKTKSVLLLMLVCVFAFVFGACAKTPEAPADSSSSSSQSSESQSEEQSTHTHNYNKTEIVKEANCTEAGEKKLICDCGDSKTETIPAKGHTWDNGTVTKEATCLEAGVKTFVCTVAGCNGEKQEEIPAKGHTWDEGTVTTEPDCQTKTNGVKTFKCTVEGCTGEKTEAIKYEHSYGADNVCTVCGEEKADVILNISTLTVGNITATQKVDDTYTIIPGDKPLTVEQLTADEIAEDLTHFTHRLKTGGASDLAKKRRLIQINAPSAGTVTVYAKSGNSTDLTRKVVLYGVAGQLQETEALDGAKCKSYDLTIDKAGVYFIGANNGVSIYQVSFKPSASSGSIVAEPYTLSANTLALMETGYTAKTTIDDHTEFLATTDGLIKVAGTTKLTTDGKTFTQRITLNTTGNMAKSKCLIKISIPAGGSFTVYCRSSGKSANRTLCVDNGVTTQNITAVGDYNPTAPDVNYPELTSPATINVDVAGDYYFYSLSGGIYVYEIAYTPNK